MTLLHPRVVVKPRFPGLDHRAVGHLALLPLILPFFLFFLHLFFVLNFFLDSSFLKHVFLVLFIFDHFLLFFLFEHLLFQNLLIPLFLVVLVNGFVFGYLLVQVGDFDLVRHFTKFAIW